MIGAVVSLSAALGVIMATGCASEPNDADTQHAAPAAEGGTPAKLALEIAAHAKADGDFANAVVFYRRALEIDPNSQPAMIGLGETLLDAGAPNDAADAFRKALDKRPDDPEATSGLGVALVKLGQPAAAIDLLRKGLASAPSPRGWRALAVAENVTGQYGAAVADCRKGLALAPNDLGLRTDLGLSQALNGDFDAAIATMKAVAGASGARAQHRQTLALVLGLAGHDEEAWKVAQMDLDERSARSNLAYYAQLRAMPAKDRAQAILRPTS